MVPAMKQHILKIMLAMSLAICLGVSSHAQTVSKPRAGATGSWRLLGTVSAKHTADHDVIVVTGPHDFFRHLKFKVTNSPVNIHKLVVTYDDGGLPEIIETRFEVPKNGESRVIDLKGIKRRIKTIEFWYDTKGILNGKANVTVFGQK